MKLNMTTLVDLGPEAHNMGENRGKHLLGEGNMGGIWENHVVECMYACTR